MSRTRFEQYFDLNAVPFKFYWKLKRTEANAGNPANWHDNLEVQYCNSGEGYVLLDGQRYDVKAGDIIVANSNSIHFTGTNSNITFSVIIFDTKFCRDVEIDHTKLIFEPIFRNDNIKEIFEEMKYAEKNEVVCKTAVYRMLALRLLIELRHHHVVEERKTYTEKASFKAVKEAVTFIHEHYSEHFTLDDIAATLFIDKYNLARKFKEHTGKTIINYTNEIRCNNAKVFILQGMPVHEAARICGFGNMSFFTKTFKKHIGKTPSAYKQNQRR